MKDFINKTPQELTALITEKKAALREFAWNKIGGKVKNVWEGKTLRKDIARLSTILSSKK
jgi:ribosomal protein L29